MKKRTEKTSSLINKLNGKQGSYGSHYSEGDEGMSIKRRLAAVNGQWALDRGQNKSSSPTFIHSEETPDNKPRILIFEDAKVKESHILDCHDLRRGFGKVSQRQWGR
jgi:hypothetical protein